MCCLFGILDYRHSLTEKQLNKMIAILSKTCEARGTDATGISYNHNNKLCIYKRPLAAHKMRYHIPDGVHTVMGHTRMTTQGDEKFNYNNHPFYGKAINTDFALAHNGVIYNDESLKIRQQLPETKIVTDSYVAVQLIEKKRALGTDSLKFMAEQLRGSFTITLLDKANNLYFVKGDNPMCIYYFKDKGVYIYASTEEILSKAISKMQMKLGTHQKIEVTCGEILVIDKNGYISRSKFDTENLESYGFSYPYYWRPILRSDDDKPSDKSKVYKDEYMEYLKAEAEFYGYSPSLIETLIEDGYSVDDIEELIYCSA